MNGQHQQDSLGIGWIILLVLLCIIFNPIPCPIDDAAVAVLGAQFRSEGLMPDSNGNEERKG